MAASFSFGPRLAAIIAIIAAPFVFGAGGLALAFLIGGIASDWHPDVGGALGIRF